LAGGVRQLLIANRPLPTAFCQPPFANRFLPTAFCQPLFANRFFANRFSYCPVPVKHGMARLKPCPASGKSKPDFSSAF